MLILFENEDEKNIFVEGEFLGYNGSSFKDGSFEFFVIVKFSDDILIEGIKEFGKHGLFFLFFFKGRFWIGIVLLLVRVLLKEFLIRREPHLFSDEIICIYN